MQKISTLLAMALVAVTVGACGYNAELDPRDKEAIEEYENACNRRSTRVTLVVENLSTYDLEITVVMRSGARRKLIPYAHSLSRSEYKLPRSTLDSGGALIIVPIRGGLNMHGNGYVEITPMSCDVGTLEVYSTMNQIYYMGAEW